MSKYATSPPDTTEMPKGIPHIIGNEAAERFSFYGMRGILAIFMFKYLHYMDPVVGDAMSKAEANEKVHLFIFAVYITPFLGALLSDIFWGKYRTIIALSLVYCAGHASLAFMGFAGQAIHWLYAGLCLIALGSGGIKPCVSAHVGDQFGKSNSFRITRVFNYFYFSINFGAFLSMMLTPWLLKWHGPHIAFGVPGVLMAIATLVFWMGRNRFVHVPPGGMKFIRETFSLEGFMALGKLCLLFLFVAMFWSLFDQTASSWIFQAQDMDRNFLGFEWLPSQLQAINSVFVLTFIPLFTFWLYPTIDRFFKLTPLRKIGIGLFLMVGAFALGSTVQEWIDAGQRPNVGWQILAYALLTAAEVMVSIVGLEFAYTQAPRTMKSIIMSLYLAAVAVGNLFTAGVNHFIQIPPTELTADKPHPGFDQTLGTNDDLAIRSDDEAIESPVQELLHQSYTTIQSLAAANDKTLPSDEDGTAALASENDPWGNPLRYKLLNATTARISSDGPDGQYLTQWDLGISLSVRDSEDQLDPNEWLAKRIRKMGAQEDPPDPADVGDASLLKAEYYAGGQTKLEGAAYFWFFTILMLGTAILFIPYAYFYRGKTILQE